MKLAIAVVCALVACKGADGEYSGIGHWRFGVTTLKDASNGRCTPQKLADGRDATWCLGLQSMKVGKRSADTELYFLGNTPAVARASYIDPRVFDRFRDGYTIEPVLFELGDEPDLGRPAP